MPLRDGRPSLVFGITGGFLQPQGHLQLLKPSRLRPGRAKRDRHVAVLVEVGRRAVVEDGMPDDFYTQLAALGHEIMRRPGHRGFGGAQIISLNHKDGVLIGNSEPRHDVCVIGY